MLASKAKRTHCPVAIDQADLGSVVWRDTNGVNELVERGNTRAAANQRQAVEVMLVAVDGEIAFALVRDLCDVSSLDSALCVSRAHLAERSSSIDLLADLKNVEQVAERTARRETIVAKVGFD